MAKKSTYEELEQRMGVFEKRGRKLSWDDTLVKENELSLALINMAPIFFVAIDGKGKIMMMNHFMLKNLGYDANEVMGEDYLLKIVPERDRDKLASVFRRLTEAHEHTLNENHILTKDGKEILVEWHGIPIFDKNNKLKHFYGFGINISERKEMEEALRESEDKYKSLANNLNVGVYRNTTGPEGKFIEANPAIVKMFGFESREEFLKIKVSDLYKNPNDREEYNKKLLKKGALKNEELQLQKKDGTSFTASVSAVLVGDEENEEKYYDGVIEDITERIQAENALRESEKFSSSLLDNSPTPILVVNEDGTIRHINPAFVELTGYSSDEVQGKKAPHPWWINDPQSANIEERRGAIFKKKPKREKLFRKKNGEEFWVETTTTPIILNGKFQYALTTWVDISDRKRAEEEQFETLARFSGFAEASQYGMGMADLEGHIVYVNPALVRMLGEKSAEDCLGKHFPTEYYPSSIARKLQENVIPTLMRDGNWHGELELLSVDHRRVPTYENFFVLRDESGRPVYLADILTDISERKKVEKALQDSERNFRRLFEQSNDAIFVHQEGRVIDVNKKACEMLGYRRDQLLKMSVGDWAVESLKDEVKKRIDVTQRGDAIYFETQWIKADGSIINVEVSSSIVDRDKKVIQGVARDITDRKKAELSLKESEKRFRELSEMLPEAVFETDDKMNLVYANQQAFSLFGYTQDDFEKGLNALEIVSSEDRMRAQENIAKRFQGEEIGSTEYNAMRKDGSMFPVLLHANPIIDQGTVQGLRGIIIDITDRKRTEAHLQQAQKVEAIGNLAGGIAHDFNNILFPIVGISEMFMEDLPADSPERENVRQIFKAAMRGRDLVKQILAFSRQSEQNTIPIRIQKVLKEVFNLSRSTIPSYIEITLDIRDDCGLVLADRTQVHQIAMNLITNAYHAVEPSGGKIDIRLNETELDSNDVKVLSIKPGRYVALSISDTGSGIDPAIMEQIFDPYFTTKEQGKGTGLGLAVVHGIIKEHGGDIKVDSDLGKGTKFTVYLPLMKETVETAPKGKADTLPAGHERILLVDDEETIVYMEKKMLERLGYQISFRTSSVDALEAFKANPETFNLVITDMTMPNMTGDQLAKELISIKPNIPIILCTGFSERIDREKSEAIGIKGFLMKPVVLNEIAKMVRKVLDEEKSLNNPDAV